MTVRRRLTAPKHSSVKLHLFPSAPQPRSHGLFDLSILPYVMFRAEHNIFGSRPREYQHSCILGIFIRQSLYIPFILNFPCLHIHLGYTHALPTSTINAPIATIIYPQKCPYRHTGTTSSLAISCSDGWITLLLSPLHGRVKVGRRPSCKGQLRLAEGGYCGRVWKRGGHGMAWCLR